MWASSPLMSGCYISMVYSTFSKWLFFAHETLQQPKYKSLCQEYVEQVHGKTRIWSKFPLFKHMNNVNNYHYRININDDTHTKEKADLLRLFVQAKVKEFRKV